MKNGEQPAFPKEVPDGDRLQNGLTKREYFAAMAMQGLLSGGDGEYQKTTNTREPKYIALLAVDYADELLKQLEQ